LLQRGVKLPQREDSQTVNIVAEELGGKGVEILPGRKLVGVVLEGGFEGQVWLHGIGVLVRWR
jgi:hypothetical protein